METWQKILQASITKPGDLTRKYGIDPRPLEEVTEQYPMRVNPYYLSLIKDVDDPIWRQSVPSEKELHASVCHADPLEEENQSPVPNLVHRYPDRALFLVCSECAMYCRFCTRKRKVGGESMLVNRETIERGLDYLRAHAEIRDVIVSQFAHVKHLSFFVCWQSPGCGQSAAGSSSWPPGHCGPGRLRD